MKSVLLAGICALFSLPAILAATNPQDQLSQLAAAGNGVITLTADTFNLLTSPKRTWSASVQLTALDPKRRCVPCKDFKPAWEAIAKAWSSVPTQQRSQHFFATLDFDTAPTVFQQLGIATAPVVFNYPAAEGPRKPANGRVGAIKYDFQDGFDAGPLAEQISRHTPIPVPYRDPIDWMRWATIAIGGLTFVLLVRFILPVVKSRWTWAAATVLIILVMTSGFMFTRIRAVPYTGRDGGWIAAGFQNQFGQEVQVVSFVYGLLAFAFLMLTMVVPLQTSPQRQRMQVYLWTGVIMIIYSVLISLFKVKNRGYPFKLFL